MKRLTGKAIVVAGAGSGLGAVTAARLAQEGAKIIAADLLKASAEKVAQKIVAQGGEAIGLQFDIADDASVSRMVAAASAAFGGLDGIHVNAANMKAILSDTDAVGVPLDIFDATIAVNLRGHLLCTRHAVPELLKRGGGSIVYTSSASAFAAEITRVAYGISKSGLHALMRHVASRWGKEGIRANAIAPGLVITEELAPHFPEEVSAEFMRNTRGPRLGKSEDIAAMVAMLMSADGEWITGQVLSVDGGQTVR
jgi:NAD(P)-dependent dehydrogenase (short-subunit alcohol dehydrogenase family)